jgi:signal transduction histidine kinase
MSDEDMRQLATMYLEETLRIQHIIEDLLTLSRADAKEMLLEMTQVPIGDLVRDVADDASILASSKDLSVELGPTADAVVMGDPTRLRQMLRALVSNAVRYTEAGGAIRLSSMVADQTAHVTVQDTGIGIPAESLPHVFERFYRVDASRSRDGGGSGLGLALAKWIAESHGGSISVESELGKGSTFVVHLPLAQDL